MAADAVGRGNIECRKHHTCVFAAQVERGVAHDRGDHELQLGKAAKQGARKRHALAQARR